MTDLVGRIVCTLIATACLAVPQARAQNANTVTGEYCLVGVREVGSCMRLSPGGKWEYFLSYGAYDERSEGTWKAANGGVVVNSPPYDRRATFSFKRLQKSESGAYTVLVVSKADRGIAGIDVVVTCDGATKTGYTQTYGLEVDCAKARPRWPWRCACSASRRKPSTWPGAPAPRRATCSNSNPAIWGRRNSRRTACKSAPTDR